MARSVAPAGSLCVFEPAEAVCLWLGDDWHGHWLQFDHTAIPAKSPHRNANKIETNWSAALFVSDRKRSWEFGEKFRRIGPRGPKKGAVAQVLTKSGRLCFLFRMANGGERRRSQAPHASRHRSFAPALCRDLPRGSRTYATPATITTAYSTEAILTITSINLTTTSASARA